MPSLGEVNIRVGADIKNLQRNLDKAQREVERAARNMIQLGDSLTSSLSLPILAAGAASVKFASEFEASFTKIETLVGVTGETLEQFKTGIDQISDSVGKSRKELSDALFVITSAGQRGASALETLEAASKASSIGLGATDQVARAAVASVQAYGEANLSSAEAVDKLTAIVREGNLAAEELAPTIGRVLPVAASLGVSFDEVGANIAVFTRLGVNAAEAVTSLRALLSSIANPAAEAERQLASVGLTMDDVRKSIKEKGLADTLLDLQDAFGGNIDALSNVFGSVEALTNVLGTAGAQADTYRQVLDSISNSTGIVDEGFEKFFQTSEAKMGAALVSLQNVAIDLGNIIVPVFTDVLEAVTKVFTAFGKLPEPISKTIAALALVAASSGPVLSVLGNMRLLAGSVTAAFHSIAGAGRIGVAAFVAYRQAAAAAGVQITTLTGVMPALTAAWRALNTVAKATVIGAALAVITTLVVAVSNLNKKLTETERIQRTLDDVSAKAASEIAGEKAEVEALSKIVADTNAKYEDRHRALQRLQEISPDYFKDLSLENDSYKEINVQAEKYIQNILAAARARAINAKINELEEKKLELQQQINDEIGKEGNLWDTVSEAFNRMIGNDFLSRITRARKEIELLEKQQKSLAEALSENILTSPSLVAGGGVTGRPAGGGGGIKRIAAGDLLPSTQDIQTSVAIIARELEASLNQAIPVIRIDTDAAIHPLTLLGEQFDIIENKAAAFGDSFDPIAEKLKLVENTMKSLLESGVSPYSASIEFLKEQHAELQAQYDANIEKQASMQATMEAFSEAGQAVGNAIVQSSNEASAGLAAMGRSALVAARQFVAAKLREFVAAQLVKTALASGPFGALLAPAIGAIAAAAFNSIIASLKIPAFAHGGLLTGPAVILAGEGPGTSASNPEVIAPLNKLKDMLGSHVHEVRVTGQLYGHDILISNERTAQRRSRMRGF